MRCRPTGMGAHFVVALATLLLVTLSAPPTAAQAKASPSIIEADSNATTDAVEGDMIRLDGTNVRLYGIDAPDPGQTCRSGRGVNYDCFELSRRSLERLLTVRPIKCTARGPQVNNVQPAICTINGQDISYYQVVTGWALAYRSLSNNYISAEALAHSKRRGLWGGQVEPPWLFRSRQVGKADNPMGPAANGATPATPAPARPNR